MAYHAMWETEPVAATWPGCGVQAVAVPSFTTVSVAAQPEAGVAPAAGLAGPKATPTAAPAATRGKPAGASAAQILVPKAAPSGILLAPSLAAAASGDAPAGLGDADGLSGPHRQQARLAQQRRLAHEAADAAAAAYRRRELEEAEIQQQLPRIVVEQHQRDAEHHG